jgi:endonuclease YncB( thermonuclease family)
MGVEQYGRMLGVCSARYGEINRIMVEQGWAVAYRQYSDAYASEELRAKTGRQGLWASSFAAPSEYRQSNDPAPAQHAATRMEDRTREYRPTPGCAIKGNRYRRGE